MYLQSCQNLNFCKDQQKEENKEHPCSPMVTLDRRMYITGIMLFTPLETWFINISGKNWYCYIALYLDKGITTEIITFYFLDWFCLIGYNIFRNIIHIIENSCKTIKQIYQILSQKQWSL